MKSLKLIGLLTICFVAQAVQARTISCSALTRTDGLITNSDNYQEFEVDTNSFVDYRTPLAKKDLSNGGSFTVNASKDGSGGIAIALTTKDGEIFATQSENIQGDLRSKVRLNNIKKKGRLSAGYNTRIVCEYID